MNRVSPDSRKPILLDHMRSVAVFVTIVEQGSFRAAAAQLQLSPSVASHHITALEAQLGVALLYRSTRRLSLTSAGSQLLKSAQALVRTTEQTLRELAVESSAPVGPLRVAMPNSVALSPVMGEIWAFAARNPGVRFSFHVADDLDPADGDDADLIFRMGPTARSGSPNRLIHYEPRRVLGAPGLVAQMPEPSRPADLASWPWIATDMRRARLELRTSSGETAFFKTRDVVSADAAVATLQLTIAGAGLSLLPTSVAEDALAAGRLVEVLPDWRPPPAPVHVYWTDRSPRRGLTTGLIAFLHDKFFAGTESPLSLGAVLSGPGDRAATPRARDGSMLLP